MATNEIPVEWSDVKKEVDLKLVIKQSRLNKLTGSLGYAIIRFGSRIAGFDGLAVEVESEVKPPSKPPRVTPKPPNKA